RAGLGDRLRRNEDGEGHFAVAGLRRVGKDALHAAECGILGKDFHGVSPDGLRLLARRQSLSSVSRNFDRSRGEIAALSPLLSPVSRKWAPRSRMALAMPILVSSKPRPVGPVTSAPAATQRTARGTSAVMTI